MSVTMSPNARWLVTVEDATPEITGQTVMGGAGRGSGIFLLRTGTQATSSLVRAWDLTAKVPAATATVLPTQGTIQRVAISPDSRWLVAGRHLWDLTAKAPAEAATILEHDQGITSLAYTSDSQRLAIGTSGGTLRLWDLSARFPATAAIALRAHEGAVLAMAVSGDNHHLVSRGNDKTVRVWNLRLNELMDQARRVAGRELTVEERSTYLLPGLGEQAKAERMPPSASPKSGEQIEAAIKRRIPLPPLEGTKPVPAAARIAGATPLSAWTCSRRPIGSSPQGLPQDSGNNLAALPKGEQTFAGIRFRIGESFLQLGNKFLPETPQEVEGIQVGVRVIALYILQASHWCNERWGVPDGTTVAQYRVRYEDGSQQLIPVVSGRDIGDFLIGKPVTRAAIAWRGSNPTAKKVRTGAGLYLSVWENPQPNTKVVSIDYATMKTIAAPFCVAITVEEPLSAFAGMAPLSTSAPTKTSSGSPRKVEPTQPAPPVKLEIPAGGESSAPKVVPKGSPADNKK